MLFGASYGIRTHTLLEEELLCVPNKLVPKAGVEPAELRFLAVYLCQFGYSGILFQGLRSGVPPYSPRVEKTNTLIASYRYW